LINQVQVSNFLTLKGANSSAQGNALRYCMGKAMGINKKKPVGTQALRLFL